MAWEAAWEAAGDGWRRALALAWDAYREGSIGIGAVVVGDDGQVIAEGRNRSGETEAPPGHLVGAYIAHAEVNALGQVPIGTPGPTTVLTTVEPCPMCTTAARFAHVTEVRYASADPIWEGFERVGELNAFFARRLPVIAPVDLGPLSRWSGALGLASIAHRVAGRTGSDLATVVATDPIFAASRAADPRAADLAERLLASGLSASTDDELEVALAGYGAIIASVG